MIDATKSKLVDLDGLAQFKRLFEQQIDGSHDTWAAALASIDENFRAMSREQEVIATKMTAIEDGYNVSSAAIAGIDERVSALTKQ